MIEASGRAVSIPGHRRGVWPLVTGSEMQALDRRTIEGQGVAGEILMESAGRSLIEPVLALRRSSARPEGPVRILCGAGNNGGDGFVLARHLLAEDIPAEVVLVGEPAKLPPDAAANWRRLEAIDAPRRTHAASDEALARGEDLDDASVAVDALFGTGLAREITGGHARLIENLGAARRRGLRVLSVDIPSGIAEIGRAHV